LTKKIWTFCLCAVLLMLTPSAWAEGTTDEENAKKEQVQVSGSQGSVESLLPEKPPVPTPANKEKPLYERYDIPSYAIDFEDSLSNSVVQMWNLFLTTIFGVIVVGWKLIIYFVQWSFNLEIFHSLNSTLGTWALNIRDNLFVGNVLAFGIVVLCVVLVFSLGRNQEVYEQSRKFLALVIVASVLLSFMAPILNSLNTGERFVSDLLFWVYAQIDPDDNQQIAKPTMDGDQSSLKKSRNEILIKVGEQAFDSFVFTPWQMAEFGKHPVPPYDKQELEIMKDTKTILKLNPLDPKSFVKREEYVANWTGTSVWSQMFNFAVPSPVGAIAETIDHFSDDATKYPSMTLGNTPWRSITVIGALVIGGIYGLFLFLLAAASLVCQALVLILAAIAPILLLTIFIPRWGESVMMRWTQFFVIAGLYKVIVSVILIMILFVSGLIYKAGNEASWGLGLIYFTHVCFVIAVFVFHKLLWNILAFPGEVVAGEIEGIVKGTGSRMMDMGVSGVTNSVSMLGRVAAAAVTKNPAFLVKGGGALALAIGGKNSLLAGVGQLSEGDKEDSYVPAGFTTARGGMPEFKESGMQNPYKANTQEALIFDEMVKRGLNPYSHKDQEEYAKKNIKQWNVPKEKKQAFKTIQEHGRIFEKRQKQQQQQLRTVEVMDSIDEIEAEELRREAEERRKRSWLYQVSARFRRNRESK
jgi:hypothetical protein